MRIAVLGAGRVGRALGERWSARGHDVVYGVRDPGSPRHDEHGAVAAASEAVRGADVVLLALPWSAVDEVVRELDLSGVVVIDATNPLGGAGDASGAERLAERFPSARVVKAFNSTGWEVMADTAFSAGTPVMLVAGDDTSAKEAVLALATELGFDAVDAGPIAAARELEALAALWIRLARGGYGRDIAFALLRRATAHD